MKSLTKTLVLIIFLIANKADACDICGCAMGNINFGIIPQYYKNFICFHYNNRPYSSSFDNIISKESFQSFELRGRYNINNRIQVFAFIPYYINRQYNNSSDYSLKGLGDISIIALYSLFNNGDNSCNNWRHNIQFGGGIKLPVGQYNELDNSSSVNPNLQLGSGSFDFFISGIYTIRFKNWGINNTGLFKYNTYNSNQFAFGNRLSINSSLFYFKQIKNLGLLPSTGVVYEKASQDIHDEIAVQHSGGNTIFTNIGLDIYYKNMTLQLGIQLPTHQTNELINAKTRVNSTLIYNF